MAGHAWNVRIATADDAASITRIYNEGIEERIATFETESRSVTDVARSLVERGDAYPTVVALRGGEIAAWAGVHPYNDRAVYAGIGAHSVYTARDARGLGAGRAALDGVVTACEARDFWKLTSRIFPENVGSLRLHEAAGFRVVGVYRRHGKLDGEWRDCVVVEKLLGEAATDRPAASCRGHGE